MFLVKVMSRIVAVSLSATQVMTLEECRALSCDSAFLRVRLSSSLENFIVAVSSALKYSNRTTVRASSRELSNQFTSLKDQFSRQYRPWHLPLLCFSLNTNLVSCPSEAIFALSIFPRSWSKFAGVGLLQHCVTCCSKCIVQPRWLNKNCWATATQLRCQPINDSAHSVTCRCRSLIERQHFASIAYIIESTGFVYRGDQATVTLS